MKIIFMGTPEFSVNILKELYRYHDILAVVTKPDNPFLKSTKNQSPVKKFAIENGIKIFQPIKLKEISTELMKLNCDLYLTAAYGNFLPKIILDHKPAINIHASLLPKYRGGSPIQYAIRNGDKTTGISIIHMIKKMDAGNVIKMEKIKVDKYDTYTSLSKKLSNLASKMIIKLFEKFGTNLPSGVEQLKADVTYAKNLTRDDEFLSFDQKYLEFDQQLRSLLDKPGGYFDFKNQVVKIFEIKKSDIISDVRPGTIISTKKNLTIKIKDSCIDILKIQLSGKKVMKIQDFLNGQSIFVKGDIIGDLK